MCVYDGGGPNTAAGTLELMRFMDVGTALSPFGATHCRSTVAPLTFVSFVVTAYVTTMGRFPYQTHVHPLPHLGYLVTLCL